MIAGTPLPTATWVIRTELDASEWYGGSREAMPLPGSSNKWINVVRNSSFFFFSAGRERPDRTEQEYKESCFHDVYF